MVLNASCGGGDEQDTPIITIVDNGSGESSTTASGLTNEEAKNKYGRRLEIPTFNERDGIFIAHEVQAGNRTVMNYSLEYSPTAMHSRWVAFRFDAITRVSTTGRSPNSSFIDDPLIPSQYRIGSEYFKGYDRGHLCASADRYLNAEANLQTFYMTNMSPQLNDFNSGIWSDYEIHFRDKARDATFADTVYVVKGGTIRNGETLGRVTRNNGQYVTVPKYYFMAFLRVRYGNYDAIGLWLEHRPYSQSERANLGAYIVSIDELEEKTGLDFFSNLRDDIENNVESTYNKSIWGF